MNLLPVVDWLMEAEMAKSVSADCKGADEIVKTWPETARSAASAMMEKYGTADEASASLLLWHHNGPWRRTVVYHQEVQNNFPGPHRDVVEQFIRYRVPVDKFDDLAAFDGSVLVDRMKELMSELMFEIGPGDTADPDQPVS